MRRRHITGLDQFGLSESSFRKLGDQKVTAYVYLMTYDVTPAVQKLPPRKRFLYMEQRVDAWIAKLQRLCPTIYPNVKGQKLAGPKGRLSSELPTTLKVRARAVEVLRLAEEYGVRPVYVTAIAGQHRGRQPKSPLEWYCVRALVAIRVERAKSGLQNTEDRFILVRATSFADAKKRLMGQWREYASPYLNSDGQMVSWQLEKVVDVYSTCETEIDPRGFEVYSKLGRRRMRPGYVWHPRHVAH
jgi:hypothetical protein